jgi:hypothetical protein
VTSVDDSNKLVALQRARERLELALATDAGWRALRRLGAADGGGREAAGLEAKLLANPLYRAWKNVHAAIEARQAGGPLSASLPNPVPAGTHNSGEGRADRAQAEARHEPGANSGARQPPDPPPQRRALGATGDGAGRVTPGFAGAAENEASVSFIARTPAQAPLRPLQDRDRPQRWRGGPACDASAPVQRDDPADQDGAPAPGGPLPAGSDPREAEVSVVSVDARRHASAVERLLRALHGDKTAP